MNKQELFEKALNEFDEWPSHELDWEESEENKQALVLCIRSCVDDKKYNKGDISTGGTGFNPYYFELVCTREEFEAAKAERGKFTQEFLVNPAHDNWLPCKILFQGAKHTILKTPSGREFSRRTAKLNIRDIDKRTDKERAVDDLLKGVGAVNNSRFIAELAYDKWVGDKQ